MSTDPSDKVGVPESAENEIYKNARIAMDKAYDAIRLADHLESEPSGGLREKIKEEMEWAAGQLSIYLRHLRAKNDPMALAFTNALAEFNDTCKALAATPKPPESAGAGSVPREIFASAIDQSNAKAFRPSEPGSEGVLKELWDFVTKVALGASISSCRSHARKLMEVNILTRPADYDPDGRIVHEEGGER
jgi:hypothetical protein